MISIALIGAFIAMVAFKRVRDENMMKELQAPADKGFAVVELFTSEGCSSCPPADELIERIEKDNSNKQIYVMAFHVDYWDRLGWKDRFSDAEYSKRQSQYANWLNLQTIYTPQIVVNGVSEYVGSNEYAVLGAIKSGLDANPVNTLSLQPRIENGKLHVTHAGGGNGKDATLVLALVQRSAQSNVRRGENAGRMLSHVQIVRELAYANAGSGKEVVMRLPDDFNGNDWELIGFVQQAADGRITAAARSGFQTAPLDK
jgi:hypothetical protein